MKKFFIVIITLLFFVINTHAAVNLTVNGCGSGVCEGYYPPGTTVTQTAKVDDPVNAYFTGWIGSVCHGTNPVCTFVMPNYPVFLTAIFDMKSFSTVYVNPYGLPGGKVVSNPEGINCVSTGYDTLPTGSCQSRFPVGQKVYYTITPPTGKLFKQWGATKYSGKYYTILTISKTLNIEFY